MPLIKYSGYLWSGKILTEQDKTTCFAEFFDNDAELAKRILNYNYFEVLPNLELTKKCIEDNLSLCFVRGATEQFLQDIKGKLNNFVGQKRDSLLEIYYTVLENFLNMKLCKISEVVFDNYVSKEDSSEIIKNLQDIKNDYEYIYNCYKSLWEKYRKGILSKNDGLNKKYSHIIASIDNSINELDKKVKKGVVYVDICMPEQYNTVRNEIVIKYKNGIKKQEFDGSLKSDDVLMENTGSYTVRIAIDNEEIEELFFYSYREGASYLQCVKAFVKGVKYIPEKVSVVCGIVEKAENVLREDSMFCELGEADGKKHYFDFELSKQKHGIKIKFKPV